MTEWLEIGGWIGSAVVGVIGFVKALQKKYRKNRKQRIANIWADIVKTGNTLKQVVAEADAIRALLIRSQNGGGVPGPTSPATVTVLYDACAKGTRSIVGAWNETRADHQYCDVLRRLAQNGRVHLVTEDMDAGDLKDLYERDGIKQSYVFRLGATETQMVYLSINFGFAEKLEPAARDAMRQAKDALYHLIRKVDPAFSDSAL